MGKRGWEPIVPGSSLLPETVNELDAVSFLATAEPDVVVTGLSWPIRIEETFSRAAQARVLPLVWLEDMWGGHRRCDSRPPDLILTIDGAAARLVRDERRYAKTDVRVIGSPVFDALDPAKIPETTKTAVDALRGHGTVVLLAGQGEATDDVLRVVFRSIVKTREPCVLVPRFHPKFMPEHGNRWTAAIEAFRTERPDRVRELPAPEHELDHVAACADITVSVYSTGLLASAFARQFPVSVATPATVAEMKRATGVERYPLAAFGAAVEIAEPTDLVALHRERRWKTAKAQRSAFRNAAFKARVAANAILSLCG